MGNETTETSEQKGEDSALSRGADVYGKCPRSIWKDGEQIRTMFPCRSS